MKVEDVLKLLNEKGKPLLADLVLAYLESHPNEVFRPKDKEELAVKVDWSNSGSIPGALIKLSRRGLIGSVKVKQYIIYGKSEVIENLRKILPEDVTLTKREREKRRLKIQGE